MPAHRLSVEATKDLEGIYEYTERTFGRNQASAYLRALRVRFDRIAEHPAFGRHRQDIESGTRAIIHKSHVIYYIVDDNGVLILRVLHGAQDPARQFNENGKVQ